MSTSTARPLLVVQALVVMYAVCYQLQAPLEPFLVQKLIGDGASMGGAAAQTYWDLQSAFQIVQLFGSLAVGALIDRVGVRIMFAVNFLGCAMSYGMLYLADQQGSLTLLFASKLPTAVMAGFLIAQAAAAQLTPAGPARWMALGGLVSAYTVGGWIGPATGGLLGVQSSAVAAIVGSLLCCCLCVALPGPAPAEKKSEKGSKQSEVNSSSWYARWKAIWLDAGGLLLTKLISGVANQAFGAARPLILKNHFGFDAAQLGQAMSGMFLVNAFGGVASGKISQVLGGSDNVTRSTLGGLALLNAVLAFVGSDVLQQTHFMGLALVMSLLQLQLATAITAWSTARVPSDLKGTLVGTEHAIYALAATAGPQVGVRILNQQGLPALAVAGGSVFASLALTWTVGIPGFASKSKKEKKL